ncbi:MAG: hypothetical protein EOP47_24030 [Sphingobacteriaceae bacterium]|nr:MAG: hypothetical protein EOP47_24030 [Sphingobacteriaceae bacterium]
MKINRIIILFILIAFGSTLKSYAGGWPMRPGRLLLAPSVNYFFASKSWDADGNLKSFNDNGKFTSFSSYLYTEYGINREFTFVASVPFLSNSFKSDNYNNTASGLGDVEAGLRYYFANIDYRYYFSIQGSGIAPLYTDTDLGYKKYGAEIKLAFSGSGNVFGKNFYFNLENGVRQYFGGDSGPIQDRYSGVFGITLDKKLHEQVSLGFSGTWSASSLKDFSENLSTNKDFSFVQATVGYGHSFNSSFTVFLSANQFLAGRNTGVGTSGAVSLIYRVDFR